MTSASRKATNLTFDAALIEEARALNINLSRAAEDGLRRAVRQAREAEWQAENAAALESSNRFVDAHGLPLERFRAF